MKDLEDKSGTLRGFTRMFSRNWGLKLVSLALAILIYYTLKPTSTDAANHSYDRRTESPVATVIEHVARPAPNVPETPQQK